MSDAFSLAPVFSYKLLIVTRRPRLAGKTWWFGNIERHA
jgi:hypothetical protein